MSGPIVERDMSGKYSLCKKLYNPSDTDMSLKITKYSDRIEYIVSSTTYDAAEMAWLGLAIQRAAEIIAEWDVDTAPDAGRDEP